MTARRHCGLRASVFSVSWYLLCQHRLLESWATSARQAFFGPKLNNKKLFTEKQFWENLFGFWQIPFICKKSPKAPPRRVCSAFLTIFISRVRISSLGDRAWESVWWPAYPRISPQGRSLCTPSPGTFAKAKITRTQDRLKWGLEYLWEISWISDWRMRLCCWCCSQENQNCFYTSDLKSLGKLSRPPPPSPSTWAWQPALGVTDFQWRR